MINPYVFPIKGDISRADAVLLYEEASKERGIILEFGVGASTIFLGLSGNYIKSFENHKGWIDRVEKNIRLYQNKGLKFNIDIGLIDYKNEELYKKEVWGYIMGYRVDSKIMLFYIDSLTTTRYNLLDIILENSIRGDTILIHDTRTAGHQKTVTDLTYKYYSKIEAVFPNYRGSNITKIVVQDELKYINWNVEEKDNNRMSWNKDDI